MSSQWSAFFTLSLSVSPPSAGVAEPAPAPAGTTVASPAASSPIETPKAGPQAGHGHRLVWNYPRFRAWQYAASAITSGVNFYIETTGSPYPDSRVRGASALDLAARNAFRVSSAEGRVRVAEISDYLWHGTQYFGVVESILVPLAFDRGNFDVAWQLTMVNWQVIGLAFFGTRLAHLTVSRARPSEYGCGSQEGAPRPCRHAGPSFLSGHTAMSAAGTAMTCWHHHALKLYGGGFPDTAVCAALATTTVAIGVMRVASDKHWATDVIAGLALGTGVGLGVPYFFHYGSPNPTPFGAGLLPSNVALLPNFGANGFGLSLAGFM